MRLVLTNLTYDDVKPHLKTLVDNLFQRVPAGVGSTGFVKLSKDEFRKAVEDGAHWAIEKGYGWKEDLERTELNGKAEWADNKKISNRVVERGFNQIGTLGSGNHYLEIQVVKPENIMDEKLAKKWGLFPNQIVVMFHCLPGNSKVMTEHGAWIRIKDLENKKLRVKCFDTNSHKLVDTEIEEFYKVYNKEKMFKIVTSAGIQLVVTEDHPILTKEGYKLPKELDNKDYIATYPFLGVEYKEPSDEIIVDENDIRKIHNSDKIINELKEKNLLPLRINSLQLPLLTKLLGYITGDGHLRKSGRGWRFAIIGNEKDLQNIIEDIKKLGFHTGNIRERNTKGIIESVSGKKIKIEGRSCELECYSTSLSLLFITLGAPIGNKTLAKFDIPKWVFRTPKWIQRLYLAGYFGAELTKPILTKSQKKYEYFERLSVAVYKLEELKDNAFEFLTQISKLLKKLGVESSIIEENGGGRITRNGKTAKIVLRVSSDINNLIKFFLNICYEYCENKIVESCHVLHYLKSKVNAIQHLAKEDNTSSKSVKYKPYQYGFSYPLFSEFIITHKLNPPTPVVWSKVVKIDAIENKEKYVYDIRVKNDNHNFIANNSVVGNCGSRGTGHQIATDYLQTFLNVMERKYGIKILDRELACAPFNSTEGQDYYKAMACGVNMSFANRQVILHRIREVFSQIFKQDAEKLGMRQLFDVSHNRASLEKHKIDGKLKEIITHRKGATGSYYPGREEIPKLYRDDGSPVIIGGSMETGSYLLVGGDKSHETFCSTAHGSGRTMSRTRAKQLFRGDILQREMEKKGIYVKSISFAGLAEEAGAAYKDIDDVINATHEAGISKKVCKLIPIGNVKG